MSQDVRVKIYGLNLSRLINRLINEGVLINKINIKDKFILFSIRCVDLNILDKICKLEHKKYEIVKRYKIGGSIKKVPYLFGSIFAFVIIFCYMFSIGLHINDVCVFNETNLDYDLKKIEKFLSDNQIESGVNKNILNSKNIESLILKNFDDLFGCTVEIEGNLLSVKIYPIAKKYEIGKQDIFSKYDAVVTKVDIFAGDSNVKVGDLVKQNDLLIKNNNGADGEIYGKVYFNSSKIYNQKKQNIVYSGNVQSFKTIKLFNKILYKQENNCNYSKYLTKKCDFYLTDKYIIPIICEEVFYFECEISEEIVPFEKVENDFKQKLYEETIMKIPQDAEIIKTTYSVIQEGDYTRVDCFVETIISLI